MLHQLDIHNVALIDNLSIELKEGLNILSGETGAGKSIIIDSINAILGERMSKDIIRSGTEKARVEAVFTVDSTKFQDTLDEMGLKSEDDDTVVITREFSISGKNICRVNGKMVTVSMLKEIGENLIDIHGQHDNQSLLRPEKHVILLDSFGGESIQAIKSNYLKVLSEYRDSRKKLSAISGDQGDRERKIDLLEFQINEIKKLKLKVGEDEDLVKQRVLLANSGKIAYSLTNAYAILITGHKGMIPVWDGIGDAIAELSTVEAMDERIGELSERLKNISYQFEDISSDIRKFTDEMELQPDLLDVIDERIDVISRLKRKYGKTIQDVLEYYKKSQAELEEIRKADETIKTLTGRLKELDIDAYKLAEELNRERVKAASLLESKIGNELEELEMKKARFKVDIKFESAFNENTERKYSQNGLDVVEFLISPNIGEPLKPLSKIASGGEMSRIMLAIKTILADIDMMPTLIFDEIDMGISGRAAQKVAQKLSYISHNHQVLCVTHLAQIASMADNHFLIQKESTGENTITYVLKLEGEKVKSEIARMLGGANLSEITLKHAEEMLNDAVKLKKM